MGGGSPLLPETEKQARCAGGRADRSPAGFEAKCFIAMRYWRPADRRDGQAEVASFAPDEVVLLPLYPQYSATTTGSSLKAWNETYKGSGRQTSRLLLSDRRDGLIEAHAAADPRDLAEGRFAGAVRLLFSAHGLPEKVIKAGDPYQKQIEATAAAVAAKLPAVPGLDGLLPEPGRADEVDRTVDRRGH
jgi:ferrochelatase